MFKRALKFNTRFVGAPAQSMMFNKSYVNQMGQSPLFKMPKRFYSPEGVTIRNDIDGLYADPNEVAERMIKLVSLHDKIADPKLVQINTPFTEMGLDSLDMVEVFLMAELEFGFELGDDDVERFYTINDAVQFFMRNFLTQH
mmetsp:Transcript_36020/g.40988  ORF Transcript_36020/g.40988 Transcript_36020/m.40988 type:complete len:142 (-) Transcript_36020:211-636(-)|eukprot:CAMPEP_0115007948 /NCGR_PEP_ID=MMETSP0216-20121206/21574_1 /TAXON_ID=223996 /ORGANISM="Protocruzia adherens, Strain Boccale" /LENGTH=141 /DNA_ID=CAMNT_0002375169 /DNA_START=53 /DNA_END=478 /DNA_ORIENTATION=-